MNILSFNREMKLSENMRVNKYSNKLIDRKQSSYGLIYALSQVELEILKIYNRTHLKTRFIRSSKFPTSTSILFEKKLDGSLCLYIHYQNFNNFTINN